MVVTLPWLLIATVCWLTGAIAKPPPADRREPPTNDSQQQILDHVELVQIDAKTQAFKAYLIDAHKGTILIEVAGTGRKQLEDFKQQCAKIASTAQTLAVTGPLTVTPVVGGTAPMPPGPKGEPNIKIGPLGMNLASTYVRTLDPRIRVQPELNNPKVPLNAERAPAPLANP
ncbi:hypothetical protein P2318_12225 [Myxococcaceae bacterium GXIMD 01537]